MSASAVPLPRARHGCLRVRGRRSYLRHSPPTNTKSCAAVNILRSGYSKRAAEITTQLSLIGLDELSCREGERKVKLGEAEGTVCNFKELNNSVFC